MGWDPKYPLDLKFHKKSVQLAFSFCPPKDKELGCVRVELAKALNPDGSKMDWANATKFKLGVRDVATIVARWPRLARGELNEIDLVHKPDDGRTSAFKLERSTKNALAFRAALIISRKDQKPDARNAILDDVDMVLLIKCLEAALPRMQGWA